MYFQLHRECVSGSLTIRDNLSKTMTKVAVPCLKDRLNTKATPSQCLGTGMIISVQTVSQQQLVSLLLAQDGRQQ